MNTKEEKKASLCSKITFWLFNLGFFGSILVVFPIYSIWDFKRHQELHRVGIPTTAIVSGKHASASSRGGPNYYLYYRYTIETDSLQLPEIKAEKQVYQEMYDSFDSGDSIDIIYHPLDISFSDIAASDHYYFYRRIFVVALILDSMFLFLYLGARKSGRITRESELND